MISWGQRYLLDRLTEKKSGILGECFGEDLNYLIELGFVEIKENALSGETRLFSKIFLTEAGWKAAGTIFEITHEPIPKAYPSAA